ncbi:hypothetical protein JCM5296_004807, partial [Sporobolomyces johnsonii]
AVSLIQRYSYTLGSSPFAFLSIQTGGDALSSDLSSLANPAPPDRRPAFLALNDDIPGNDEETLGDIDARLRDWFGEVWPEATEWEKG